MSKTDLNEIIASMITRGRDNSRTLSRGLTLVYNPDGAPHYRMTTIRSNQYPSQKEIEIVKACIAKALNAQARPYRKMEIEPWLRSANQFYHVITWEEGEQRKLL